MTEKPRVSVITAAYQAEKTIGAAISSCLSQTYPDVEIIVTNDGSTDRTSEIAHAHGVTVIDQDNHGLSHARNRAIAASTGELLLVCDSDDILLPPAISSLVELYVRHGTGKRMVTSQAYFLTPGGINPRRLQFPMQHPEPDEQRLALLHTNWLTIFTLFPRALVEEVGGFDEDLRQVEDWDMWLRAVYSGYEVIRQPKPHCLYRWAGDSLSTQRQKMYDTEDVVLSAHRARESAKGNLRPQEQAYLDQRLQEGSPRRLIDEAEMALRGGNHEKAKEKFHAAWQLARGNRKLMVRAQSIRVPGMAHFWARRQRRIDAQVGWRDKMRR
jgi:glycosyltransferase involved in cell wall biosynthesis